MSKKVLQLGAANIAELAEVGDLIATITKEEIELSKLQKELKEKEEMLRAKRAYGTQIFSRTELKVDKKKKPRKRFRP